MLSKPTVLKLKDFSRTAAFQNKTLSTTISRIWSIGNLEILEHNLLGFFCSTQCPGNIILQTYDLIRGLRDLGIPMIGGFHSPMEKECLELLLRGTQPIVICPARSIENMRIPLTWRESIDQGRLLLLSAFESHHRRPTTKLAEMRNHFVATIADEIFVAYATRGGKTECFCRETIVLGQSIFTFNSTENQALIELGAEIKNIADFESLLIRN